MTLYLTATDAFELTWPDPADGERTWAWDGIHVPRAMPRYTAQRFADVLSLGLGVQVAFVNGYCYMRAGRGAGMPPEMPRGMTAIVPWWEDQVMPACREVVQEVEATAWELMPPQMIVEHVRAAADAYSRAFAGTLHVIMALTGTIAPFLELCTVELGEADGPLAASMMLQSPNNATVATGRELEELAQLAAGDPAVAVALRDGHADAIPPGSPFATALDAWLAEHGGRFSNWFDLHTPTWREDPAPVLDMIRRFMDDPERRPSATLAKGAAAREQTIAEVRERLGPERAATLEAFVADLAPYTPIVEARAYWQQRMAGAQRLPILALGDQLAAAGMLAQRDDVFQLDLDELAALASGEQAVSHEEIARRAAQVAHWQTLIPPPFLGPQPPRGARGAMATIFGGPVEPSADARLVQGRGACKGTVQGRARVALTFEAAQALQPGEILVCRFTAPTWTPLFATAAGVVTDHGGILSHAALVAREYGVPTVVGTSIGTEKIPDGAVVTVDGERGLVRIDSEV